MTRTALQRPPVLTQVTDKQPHWERSAIDDDMTDTTPMQHFYRPTQDNATPPAETPEPDPTTREDMNRLGYVMTNPDHQEVIRNLERFVHSRPGYASALSRTQWNMRQATINVSVQPTDFTNITDEHINQYYARHEILIRTSYDKHLRSRCRAFLNNNMPDIARTTSDIN
jgi:hypothetical protein